MKLEKKKLFKSKASHKLWKKHIHCAMNILLPLCAYFMADPESFVRGGPTLTTFVLVDGGREVPNTTKSGASSACQRTAI